ncbi:MAG: trimethylamine methyltransferase family protein [Desulfobacterales bacterium]|nr:trimethylamine methyltransferase family protein [Desulfobacterales bacterium]
MKYIEYFSQAELEAIHTSSLKVLESVGIDFLHEPARKVMAKAGCKVDGNRVFIPPKLVETQIAKPPAEFTLYARNPEKSVVIGGDNTVYMPCYGAPVVNTLDDGRRDSILNDYINFVKLTHCSPNQDMTGGLLAEPNDIPHECRGLEMLYAAIRYSDKPFMGIALNSEVAEESIKAVSIVFGSRESMVDKPPFVSILGSRSPLSYDGSILAALMTYAEAGIPLLVSALSIAGATGPVNMEGALVVQNAEVLAGITLTQLIREGLPVIYGGQSTSAAMRYGTLSVGAPEMAINTSATAQLARFYQLPSRSGGAITDSKVCDAQAGSESMMGQLTATLSGVNFVLHSAGILETYMVACYEKFILDDEICGVCKRIKKGEQITEDRLSVDLISRVGPGGEYLTNEHTFKNFRSEFYQPLIEERSNYATWQRSGALTIEKRANAKWKETLANYTEPGLPEDIERDLRQFVDSKKRCIYPEGG